MTSSHRPTFEPLLSRNLARLRRPTTIPERTQVPKRPALANQTAASPAYHGARRAAQGKEFAMRKGAITRKTKETSIEVGLDLDGSGLADVTTGVGFFDHMLDQLARHSLIDIKNRAEGDRHIDDHHTVEDVGIALGQALGESAWRQEGCDPLRPLPLAHGRDLDPGRARRFGPAIPRLPDRVSDRKYWRFRHATRARVFPGVSPAMAGSRCISKRFTARTAITLLNCASKASPARFATRSPSMRARPSACLDERRALARHAMSVAIIDYGSGNLHSARKAFERAAREAGLSCEVSVTARPEDVLAADHVVLPGVGAFADCRRGLDGVSGMVEAMDEAVRQPATVPRHLRRRAAHGDAQASSMKWFTA